MMAAGSAVWLLRGAAVAGAVAGRVAGRRAASASRGLAPDRGSGRWRRAAACRARGTGRVAAVEDARHRAGDPREEVIELVIEQEPRLRDHRRRRPGRAPRGRWCDRPDRGQRRACRGRVVEEDAIVRAHLLGEPGELGAEVLEGGEGRRGRRVRRGASLASRGGRRRMLAAGMPGALDQQLLHGVDVVHAAGERPPGYASIPTSRTWYRGLGWLIGSSNT